MGEAFTLADCAAAPALFYGNMVVPFGDSHKNLAAYFERLKARPSFARVLKEAEPYFAMFPKESEFRTAASALRTVRNYLRNNFARHVGAVKPGSSC